MMECNQHEHTSQMDVTFLRLQAESTGPLHHGNSGGSLTLSVGQCDPVESPPERRQGDRLDGRKKYPIIQRWATVGLQL